MTSNGDGDIVLHNGRVLTQSTPALASAVLVRGGRIVAVGPRAEIERKSEFRPTLVKRGATIGANATIVCGHVLGEYSFIAAGSVVTRDVPAFALMAGVPARRIGWMGHHGEKLGPDMVCPATGRRYHETQPDQLEEIGGS